MSINWIRNIHALWIIVYCAIISTAFLLQIFLDEEPCALCYLQRVGMLLVCSAAAMNLLFGIKPIHYGFAILASLFGGGVAIRQILLHICPSFPEFGIPFMGYSLYTWSLLTFACSLLLTALLLLFHPLEGGKPEKINKLQSAAILWLLLVVIGNVISTAVDCQLGLC